MFGEMLGTSARQRTEIKKREIFGTHKTRALLLPITRTQRESVHDGLCNDTLDDSPRCVICDRGPCEGKRGSSSHREIVFI